MKAISAFYLISSTLLLLVACQKEIDVDLNDAAPNIVIEANYRASDSLVVVRISKTSSYFDNVSGELINDATVTITNSDGVVTPIPFEANGVYKLSNYAPTFNTTYSIQVVHAGVSHEATSNLLDTMTLDTPTYEFIPASPFGDEGYWVSMNFQDLPGVANCYKIIITQNGEERNQLSEFFLGSDELTDGNYIERPIIETFQVGDTLLFELQSITQNQLDYYEELLSASSGNNAAPGNPNYRWTNKALGYFSAFGSSYNSVIIQ